MSTLATDDRNGLNVPNASAQTKRVSLRWWPAALLLIAMIVCRSLLIVFESPDVLVLMTGFMGPALAGLLILVWWCFASRASGKEKLLGLFGFLSIAVAAFALIHFSMVGFGLLILVFPTGIAAFTFALILFARNPHVRVPAGLLFAMIGFGYWDLVQSEGLTGDFKPQLLWRWEPNAEDKYMASLGSQNTVPRVEAALSPIPLASAQWPGFRGADRNGIASGVVLDENWTQSPPKEIWRRLIGPGWSSFSVAGDRVFTQEQRGDDEVVLCLDAHDGEIIWEYAYPSRFWEAIGGPGPRATPTIADEGIFALGADGILVCLDATRGSEVWRRDLKQDADRKPPIWGFSASPLVTDSLVVVHAGGAAEKGLFAYEADSGQIAWSVPSGDHSYSSAQLATFDSTRGILMLTNDGLQFLEPSSGKLIWEYKQPGSDFRVLQPLVVGSSVLMSTSANKGTRKMTVLRDKEDQWQVVEDWVSLDMTPEFSDYVVHEDHVYGFDGNIFACIDVETGTRQWKRGRYGSGQVILLADSGQLLVASERGELVLINATPEKLDEVAILKVMEGKTWNHPVLIGDRVYLRNGAEAVCLELPLANRESKEE